MATANATLGPIERGVVYPLGDFQTRVGWGRHAMRAARRRGLRVRYEGGRGFVRGDDFHDYLTRADGADGESD